MNNINDKIKTRPKKPTTITFMDNRQGAGLPIRKVIHLVYPLCQYYNSITSVLHSNN